MVVASASTWQAAIALASLVGGGGIIALLRFKPERESIIAQASKTAVEAMEMSLDRLRAELENTQRELSKTQLAGQEAATRREQERLDEQIIRHDLKERVAALEKATDLRPVLEGMVLMRSEIVEQRKILKQIVDQHDELFHEILDALKVVVARL